MPRDELRRLAKQLNKKQKPTIRPERATLVRIGDDGTAYVHFDGGVDETPAIMAMDANIGDTVTVWRSGGRCIINGNTTSPADVAKPMAIRAQRAAVNAQVRADEAQETAATVQGNLSAATGRIDDLEADHVSTTDLQAVNGEITNLKAKDATIEGNITAATGRIGTIEADYLKAADMTAEQARVNNILAGKATVNDLNAATGRITVLESTKANIADIEANYITADDIEATYMHADMTNSDVAWIQNGVIANGAISSAMINDVSANKLTAGTINGSVINVTNLNADNITAGTINGQRIGTGSLSLDKLSEDVYTESEVDAKLATMQAEIDGAIETWTGTEVPTLNNTPASGWQDAATRDTHVGDVYFVVNSQSQQNGYNYRFTKSGSTYSWQLIKDNDVTNALQRISAAEGKITTFDSDISTLKTDTGTLTTRTTSLETRADGVDSALLDKVDTTEFNELSDTVDDHTQTLSQHTTAISNKADGSTVNALTTRVSKNEQDISGINSTIGELQTTVASKADGSDLTTVSNKLNTVSDTVDGHTQTISSVQSTLATKADGSTVETLTTRVSDVEQDVSGFKTTVSETYATKSEAKQTGSDSGKREIVTEDAAELPLLTLTAYGECQQDGTPTPDAPVPIKAVRGRNLISFDVDYSTTRNGITFERMADGGTHVYGTATAMSDVYMSNAAENRNLVKVPAGTYTFSVHGLVPGVHVITSGGNWNGFPYKDFNGVDNWSSGNVTDGTKPFSYFVIRVDSGKTVDTVVYMQVEAGSTPTHYVPYGCIGVTTTGKNLLPITLEHLKASNTGGTWNGNSYTFNGITWTVNDDMSIRRSGTASARSILYLITSSSVVLPSGTYIAKQSPIAVCTGGVWTTLTANNPVALAGGALQQVWIDVANGATVNDIFYPQLELGTEATEYEPYRESVSYIDLKGEELCNLPDGTQDVLTVDASGHVEIEKLVAYTDAATTDGVSATVGTDAWSTTGDLSDGADVYYPLAEPRTTDLGYIDLPTTFPNGTVHVEAEIQPVIDAIWWTAAGYDAGKAYNDGNGSADLAALTERVTTAESSITQQAGQIALKANASDVYTKQQTDGLISTEVSNRNSAIQQSAEAINLSVSQNYTTKTEFNALDVDSTNLMKNARQMPLGKSDASIGRWRLAGNADMQKSRVEIDDGPYGPCGAFQLVGTQSTTTDTSCFGMDNFPFPKNYEIYEMSLYARVTSGEGKVGILCNGYSKSRTDAGNTTEMWGNYNVADLTTEWKRIWVRFKVLNEQNNLYFGGVGTNATIQICMVRLGQASATQTSLESAKAEIKVTTDGISSEVEKKTDKATIISTIRQSAESVKIKASQVEIEGAAIFTSGRLSQSSLDGAYDASGAADTALTNAKSYVDGKGYQTASDVSQAIATGTSNFATKANAVKRTQRIYYRKSASGAPAAPGTASTNWVTNGNTESSWTKYNAWSTRIPPIAESKAEGATKYLYLYTCEQREMADGTLAYTTVLLDDSTTVIDGGNIITGSVSANKIVGHSISADQLTVGVNNSIADAATTATNYITEVTGGGIKVHDANDTSDYVQITSDGMDVYNDGESAARFGADGVGLGRVDGLHTHVDEDSFDMFTDEAESNSIFHVGYPTGATVTDTFVGDGTTTEYMLSNTPSEEPVVTVTVDGVTTTMTIGTEYTHASVSSTTIAFTSGNTPVSGAVIKVSYPTAAYIPYYTMGVRSGNAGEWSVAEGHETEAPAYSAHAEGSSSRALGDASHAEGENTTAYGVASHAEGYETSAYSVREVAPGVLTTQDSFGGAHAEGQYTEARGEGAHAEGSHTNAHGEGAHAEGKNTSAINHVAHAEGHGTVASGTCSHAEGSGTTASSSNSHAEGGNTAARGFCAHAEGYQTTASGWLSHAEGYKTTASGQGSHAQNFGTVAAKDAQTVIGTYNSEDTATTTTHPSGGSDYGEYALVIGNGTGDDNRSNALTTDWNGYTRTGADAYRVLWKGTSFMHGTQTITLSENISEQGHGIVLVWSRYDATNHVARDEQFTYSFIPKYHVALFSGKGVACPISTPWGKASKYLYVSDASITGHEWNDDTRTVGNVTDNNGAHVLRAVIGV